MPRNTETTTKFRVDISELKQSLRDANRAIALTNSEFKAATAGMEKWSDSADGLSAKITQLKSVNQNYTKILDEVQKKYDNVVRTEGENSESAQNLQIKMNSLKAAIKGNEAAISKYEKSLDELDRGSDGSADGADELADALQETGDEAKRTEKKLDGVNDEIDETGDKSEKSSGKLKGFLGAIGKGAIAGIGTAVTALAGGLVAATENSKEFTDNMTKLTTASDSAGISTDFAEDAFSNLYGILGDETAANTTVSNFMAMGTSTENLNSLLNSSAGIWAKYGDSIPLDGLAESVNETAKVGQITGNLADALNWAGVNEDDFNDKLSACSDEQERQQLIVDTLNGLYGELGTEYQNNNQAMIDLNKAQLEMKSSIAQIGTAFTPVLAMFTQFGAGVLSSIVPDVENIASAFTDLANGVDGADQKIGTAIGNILTTLVTTITGILPSVVSIGVTIIQSLAQGITDNAGMILLAAQEIIMTLAKAAISLAPQLLTNVVEIVSQIANQIIALAPQLLLAAIQLFSVLVDAIMQLDLGSQITSLIDTLLNTIVAFLPQMLDAATQLFMQIVNAIPELLNHLLPKLPEIINTISTFLISALPQIINAAVTMLMGLVEALPQILQALIAALPSIIQALVNFLTQNVPVLLQAAIQLFMALVQAIPQIVVALVQAVPQIIAAIIQGLTPLGQQFADKIGECVQKVIEWAGNVKTAFTEKVTEIIAAVVQFFQELPYKIGYAIGAVIGTLATWAVNVKNWIVNEVPKIIENIIQFFKELPGKVWTWLVDTINKIITWGANMKTTAKETAKSFLDNVINTIKNLPSRVWTWLQNTISKAADFAMQLPEKGKQAAQDLFDNIVNKIKEIPGEMLSIGSDIVEGLWNGISNMTQWVKDKISGFSEGVLDGIKDFFGVHSPSVVMEKQVGQFLPMGLAEGIKDKTSAAVNAMKIMGQKMMAPAQNIKNNLASAGSSVGATSNTVVQNFTQNNYSPKSLSRLEIYRQSKNLLKGARA